MKHDMPNPHRPLVVIVAAALAISTGAAPAAPADYTVYPHLDSVEYLDGVIRETEGFSIWNQDYFAVTNETEGLLIYEVSGSTLALVGTAQAIGREQEVAVADWYVHVGTTDAAQDRLTVMVVADPAVPGVAGSIDVPGGIEQIAATPTHSYLACGTAGLVVVDVATPGWYQIVGSYGTNVVSVALDGDRLCVIDSGRFDLYDVTTPGAPVLLGSHVSTNGSYRRAVLQGDDAFATYDWNEDVRRLDVSDPGNISVLGFPAAAGIPVLAGSELLIARAYGLAIADIGSSSLSRFARQVGNDAVNDVATIGGLIMVTTRDRLEILRDGLHANPEPAGQVDFTIDMLPWGIALDDVVYGLTRWPHNHFVGRTIGPDGAEWDFRVGPAGALLSSVAERGPLLATLTNDGTVSIVAVSRYGAAVRGSVTLVGYTAPSGRHALDFLDDSTLLVVDKGSGLPFIRTVDITDTANPVEIGSITCSDYGIRQVTATGDRVVAASYGYVEIFDATDRTDLQPVASHILTRYSQQLHVRGDWVYTVQSGGPGITGSLERLVVYDIQDPLVAVPTDSLYLQSVDDIDFAGDWAYQAWTGLVIDLRDPGHPVAAGNIYPSAAVPDPRTFVANEAYVVIASQNTGTTVQYLSAQDAVGGVADAGRDVPASTESLSLQASPNPFNPRVTLRFDLPAAALAHVEIFDLRGRQVADLGARRLGAGPQKVAWDGRDGRGRGLPSGTYVARVTTPRGSAAAKLVLAR